MPDAERAELLNIAKQGAEAWNAWRAAHPTAYVDLQGVDLSGVCLRGANFAGVDLTLAKLFDADLTGADLSRAHLFRAHLSKAVLFYASLKNADVASAILRGTDFSGADLRGANLARAEIVQATGHGANLSMANLNETDLMESNFNRAIFMGATLIDADLSGASFVGADLRGAVLHGCRIHGISAWNTLLDNTDQTNLIITDYDEPLITVDDLEVAQFIYLLLNNQNIRRVIDTLTSKVVLILGRFTAERKAVLNALREELRVRNYIPALVDFEVSAQRNITETVSALAHMASFVIADLSAAKSIPQELQRIIPNLPSLPIQPLIASTDEVYSMFADLQAYPWVLPTFQYDSTEALLAALQTSVISPAETKAKKLKERRDAIVQDTARFRQQQ